MKITVTVDDRALRARLAAVRMAGPGAYTAAAKAGAVVVRDELERQAPKRTGKAAEDIAVDAQDGSAEIGPRSRWYLRFHEKGTSKMAAHPFVESSVEAVADQAGQSAGKAYLSKVGL